MYQIAKSAMDDSYVDDIDYHGKNVLVIIEGLTMYLCEKDIRGFEKLCRTPAKLIKKKIKTATKLDKRHVIVAFFMVK